MKQGRFYRYVLGHILLALCGLLFLFIKSPENVHATPQSEVENESEQIRLPIRQYIPDSEASEDELIEQYESEPLEGRRFSNSKKGIQETEYMEDVDYKALGVKHVTLNFVINDCITYRNGQYTFKEDGQISYYKTVIRKMNTEGVSVSMILLLRWWDDQNLQRLILPSARASGQPFFYAINGEDGEAKQVWINFFTFLCNTFESNGCRIDNWILGNEVNQCGYNAYNYTGSSDLEYNVTVYADAMKLLNQGVRNSKYPYARTYISLDHNWTASDTGHSGKSFLEVFANKMGSEPWSVAWHAYAPALDAGNPNVSYDRKVIWNSPYVTHDQNTPYVCGSNIEVLTDFLRNNYGEQHRVILSEQGYDASGGEELQAAFVAYTYYAAEYNDMVDAVMFRAYIDNEEEVSLFGVRLGFLSGNIDELRMYRQWGKGQEYINTHKRKAYDVFKYMDTNQAPIYTNQCLQTIGVSSWKNLISAYDKIDPWIEGICWQYYEDRIDVGVSCIAEDTELVYRWQAYDLANDSWNLVADWNGGNWASWKPGKGTYWLYVEVKTPNDVIISKAIAFQSAKDYQRGLMEIDGICWIVKEDGIDLGAAYKADNAPVEFQWMSYNLDNQSWEMISDWSKSNWTTWRPTKNNFWIHVKARNQAGNMAEKTINFRSDKDYRKTYVEITGITWIRKGECFDVGAAYESNCSDVRFRWMSYNLDTKQWQNISDWYNGNWATWFPEKGNYWLYVEAEADDGTQANKCICFAVN